MPMPEERVHEETLGEDQIQQWVLAARGGDDQAFRSIVETFAGKLQAILYRMLLDWDETRDVAQETFIAAHRALGRYREKAKFQSWLFQIGVRKALDVLRKRKRTPEVRILDEEGKEDFISNQGKEDPSLQQNELTRAIEQAVHQLPTEQRTAFILAEYEGYGHAEIAQVMGGTAKRVEMHLYRARLFLREKLKSYLINDRIIK